MLLYVHDCHNVEQFKQQIYIEIDSSNQIIETHTRAAELSCKRIITHIFALYLLPFSHIKNKCSLSAISVFVVLVLIIH